MPAIKSPFLVTDGRQFRLRQVDPHGPRRLPVLKEEAIAQLPRTIARIVDLQEKLYAHGKWGVLLIFQAMDAAGRTARSSMCSPV